MSVKQSAVADDLVKHFTPFAEQMHREGRPQREIERAFKNYLGLKARQTFKRRPLVQSVGDFLRDKPLKAKAGSVTERVLFDALREARIDFVFQAGIGPYHADFLFEDRLIVEVDGPQHQARKDQDAKREKYLERRGFEILRVPAISVAVSTRDVVEEIRDRLELF